MYLQFNNKIYEQTQGTPTGLPILGLIVEVILRLEASILKVINPKMWIPYSILLERCADDVDQKNDENSTTKVCSSENETPPKL